MCGGFHGEMCGVYGGGMLCCLGVGGGRVVCDGGVSGESDRVVYIVVGVYGACGGGALCDKCVNRAAWEGVWW